MTEQKPRRRGLSGLTDDERFFFFGVPSACGGPCPSWCQPELHDENHHSGGVEVIHRAVLLDEPGGWLVDVVEFVEISTAGEVYERETAVSCRPTGPGETVGNPLELAVALGRAAAILEATPS